MNKDEALNLLDLTRAYTEEDLKKSYRNKARKWHPDVCKEENAGAHFAKINEAYEFLLKSLEDLGCVLTHTTIFDVMRG